ncbi:MAG: nucleotide exchange factor GrpE [Minisyncoccia bacterium]
MNTENEIIQDEIEELKEVAEFATEQASAKPGSDEPTEQYSEEDDMDDLTFVESDEDGNPLPAKDVAKKLRAEIKKLRTERDEYLTGWQRSKADYVNLQKDEEQKRKDLKSYITTGLVEDILPALDSFDMAMSNKTAWEKVDANWRMGIEYIQQQLLKALFDYGVEKVGKLGEKFDPNLHEAIENIETTDPAKDHTIDTVVQSGYTIGDKVVRPARVHVFVLK